MNSINEQKRIIRNRMLNLRNTLTPKDMVDKNKEIYSLFSSLRLIYYWQNFMSYINIGNEVETVGIIKKLLAHKKKVSVPVCIPKTVELLASQIYNLDELEPSGFGLKEPKDEFIRPIEPKEIEVVIIPGLAFDRKGNRLGYGKGYYDRFLPKLSSTTLKIGLAYSFQIIDKVPMDHFDIPLDIIITEKEIINSKD